ncbi:MAG: hypothetical protein A2846_05035 [Candidatus Doudnabacteria bacterium RIFCSPHIGHO2_01_FULL_49_9]|uniref:Uncharacterized protein n=1 Tax=Candidatus Doudnabacteria bacterium RIFCSPHIGHO2_01_FULL_49_9 TaxID=1817827 RepID=A0A1F5P0E6_9BACT|nr:MAG: hypothetical protein A2846_05035 [Candidatus Doudnabacteria bacterium RIFCSPHIGHO2_01_FULL_49_9]
MKRKDWFGCAVMLLITLLIMMLTTRFHDLGWLRVPCIIFVTTLFGVLLATWLTLEMHDAWLNLSRRSRIVPFAIPAFFVSVCLLGPFVTLYGMVGGALGAMLVSCLASAMFWLAALLPGMVVNFLESAFHENMQRKYDSFPPENVTAEVIESTRNRARPVNPYMR